MQKYPRITGVTGWAIPVNWFTEILQYSFPKSHIHAIYPKRLNDSEFARHALNEPPADLYIGYSLGSLWLNLHRKRIPKESKIILLAPIINFISEANKGGKTPEANLRLQIRKIKDNPEPVQEALRFFQLCRLNIPDKYISGIPTRKDLLEGLNFLNETSIPDEWPNDDLGAVGDEDPLLDARALKRHMPNLKIVKGASHEPEKLLTAIAMNPLFSKF